MTQTMREGHGEHDDRLENEYIRIEYGAEDPRMLHPGSNLSELIKTACDYEQGMNHSLASMRYADYKKLMSWIEAQLKEQDPGQWRLGPVCTTRFYGSADEFAELEKKVETIYREFEEGDKLVVFPEGGRWSRDVQVYTQDCPLSELKGIKEATKCQFENLAVLPQEKVQLLDKWIDKKERAQKPQETILTIAYGDREECYTKNADPRALCELRAKVRKGEIPLSNKHKEMLDDWYSKQIHALIRELEQDKNQRERIPEL